MRHCLHQYKNLARDTLTEASAKESVIWCCLGLCVAMFACPTSPPQPQSPLSAESRTDSNGSIATVSDSGFAPSVEIKPRHCLSIGDPEVETTLTNLGAGLAGIFAYRVFDFADPSCQISSDVGPEFDGTLTQLSLTRDHEVDVSLLAAKVATQLLDLIQNDLGNSYPSAVSYWELCLKLVVASTTDDSNKVNTLTNELEKNAPPPSLTEPALSYVSRPREDDHHVPFPALDPNSKPVHTPHRILRQTRSRAASLMSHSSLHSFSSVRSLGNLSSKSPATLSISHGISFSESPTEETFPAGRFVVGPTRGSMDSLSRALQNHSQRGSSLRQSFTMDAGHAPTTLGSPLQPTAPTLSRSSETDPAKPRHKGKGKENAEQTGLGLRPGAAGVSRTGTRFVMTCPPTPTGRGSGSGRGFPKLDPVLAALERGSKLKCKSVCLSCGTKGSNYPCCPGCGEAWCSRACRVEANSGGKHVCKRTVATATL